MSKAVNVQAVAAKCAAAPGNNLPAGILVIVTDPTTGQGVTNLVKSNFTVVNHIGFPGQAGGFSNKIVGFNNVKTGAYHILVKIGGNAPSPHWVAGLYLGQIRIQSTAVAGQAAFGLVL